MEAEKLLLPPGWTALHPGRAPVCTPDERPNAHSEGRRDSPSCFKCFAYCVYWPINYLSVSFNSLSPGKKLQTMISM